MLNLDRILVLAFGCLIMFSAINTTQNMLSKILKDSGFGNLGFYSLGLYYLAFGFAGFLSSPIIKKFGDRKILGIGALCYTIYTTA